MATISLTQTPTLNIIFIVGNQTPSTMTIAKNYIKRLGLSTQSTIIKHVPNVFPTSWEQHCESHSLLINQSK